MKKFKKALPLLLALLLLAGCAAPVQEAVETPTPAPTPTPELDSDWRPEEPWLADLPTDLSATHLENSVPLTQAEIDRVNAAFVTMVESETDNSMYAGEINGFFNCYYASPEEISLKWFLRYNANGELLTDDDLEEYQAVIMSFDPEYLEEHPRPLDAITPTHRYPKAAISAQLQKYANITVDDLLDTSGCYYQEQYDAYYNFTSDSGPGDFICVGGEKTDDTVLLWSAVEDGYRKELTLHKSGDQYFIYSFQNVNADA